ncbi:MAG: MATE family efflux transporter, partial [Erysipelotrichaceae bacterium]|nr:MATE family efflux transporter [Erysipelotrichaceae bacterium]
LRSVGDSRSPFIYLVISSIVNVVLDVVLVAYAGMGVSGVGIATIISQLVSCVLVYIRLSGTDDVYKLQIKDLGIDFHILKELINIGLPAAMQTCLVSLSNVFIQRYVNIFGSDAIAGVGAAQKVDAFASMPSQSISLAMTTYVSQNLGAEKPERVKEGIKVGIIITTASILMIAAPSYIFARPLIRLFNTDPEVVQYGIDMMHAILPLYFILGINSVYSGVVRGYGHSRAVMMLSLLAMVGLRQIYLYIGMKIFNSIYIVYYGYPFAWAITVLLVYVYYLINIRNKPMNY